MTPLPFSNICQLLPDTNHLQNGTVISQWVAYLLKGHCDLIIWVITVEITPKVDECQSSLLRFIKSVMACMICGLEAPECDPLNGHHC